MESKWYLFPGQTVENTKISDRAHALHITGTSWNNITQHLDRRKRIQEAVDKERAHREALKKGSEEMTKQWENSIENLRLKKEKKRADPFDKSKEDKIQMFYKMRAEQEVVRKEYVEKVKKDLFVSSGYPKELTSSLILSETLYEREKQKEFNEKLRKHNEEVKQRHDQNIIALDEKQLDEEKEKKLKKLEEERKVATILREQIKEYEDVKKADNHAKVERETRDRINAAREEELLKKFEHDEKMRKKREMAADKKKELEAERKRQEVLAKETLEMEMATEFYSEAKRRMECMMKLKAKEMQAEAIRKRDELAEKVGRAQESKDAVENERLRKAIAESDALDQAKAEQKKALKQQFVKERIEDRNQYLKRLEDEKMIEQEVKRWELLNRCKASEAMKEYDEQSRRQKWATILEYRRALLEQIAEDKEIMKREKEIDEIMSRVSFVEADKRFYEYANEVLELAKRRGRPTYPIEKVILEYKKTFTPQTRKRTSCRNVP